MTPTMEEVAGWLREAAGDHALRASFSKTASGALTHQAKEKEARDRAAQVEAMGWRPIEEAPVGEGAVIGIAPSGKCAIGEPFRGWKTKPFGVINRKSAKWIECTHFMPLPEPPVKK